jgi:uncharacterized protein YxjI
MRLLMKERLLTLKDRYDITDEHGTTVFTIVGTFFSFGHKLTIYDAAGNEVALIDQQLISFSPTYDIIRGGETIATVKKRLFTLFHHRFLVDVPGPDDIEARGSFWDREYVFEQHGREVARASRAFFSIGDSYGIEIDDGVDPALIVASAVVIDLALEDEKKG